MRGFWVVYCRCTHGAVHICRTRAEAEAKMTRRCPRCGRTLTALAHVLEP